MTKSCTQLNKVCAHHQIAKASFYDIKANIGKQPSTAVSFLAY